ncbi:MAG: glycosyltransferase family 4 protein [Treponema sp.]|nr:glycosyltransferase family 4 protein [Candidatus Treponema equifaecale]
MILINGNFLCRNLTGIERFAWETCKRLDKLLTQKDDVRILVPANAKNFPEFVNIKLIISDKEVHGFPKWDLIEFKKACKKLGAVGLNFSNTAPLGKYCGYAFLHDIYAKDFPQDLTSKKDTLIKLYCRLNYRNIAKHAKKVITVSNFSKSQIQKAYKVPDERIEVVPNGWEHFSEIQPDESIFEKFPSLIKGGYYFTLGSLQKRKNLKWIAEYAKNHPEDVFAISGKAISGMISDNLRDLQTLKNVTLLGYVSDEEVKSLMKNCKAFVFPSYYEGFGIPPLEALSTGAKIIIADSASLPEIYGKTATYIKADSAECDLNQLISEQTEDSAQVLNTYTYNNAAEKLYKIITGGEK